MAKRKRLTPALYPASTTGAATEGPVAGAPEVKSALGPGSQSGPETGTGPSSDPSLGHGGRPLAGAGAGLTAPPIARVAGEAATTAALQEVTEMLETARSEGRLILRLDLDSVQADYLVRDRIEGDDAELESLVESLRARGQQTPIEVVPLGAGYGLISGWRRLTALRRLQTQTGEARFATVLAILRTPESASDAYVAMVEENEIRVGLSYFERARIVDRSVAQGVFDSDTAALRSLFATASRAKRSKIGSFLPVVRLLEPHLRFPVQLNERVGLRLSKALEDPGFAHALPDKLTRHDRPDAEAERALLTHLLDAREKPAPAAKVKSTSPDKEPVLQGDKGSAQGMAEKKAPGVTLRPGLTFRLEGRGPSRVCELAGPALDDELLRDLQAWLKAR